MMGVADGYSSVVVCERARVSYRQLDYWTRIGLVGPSLPPHRITSGIHRRWSFHDLLMVAALGACDPVQRPMVRHAMVYVAYPRFVVIDQDSRDVVACESAEEVVDHLRSIDVATVICVAALVGQVSNAATSV